ncbi:MAG: 2-succinyl-5-enolpyruvyl-6-hydroxy-3-cyclohexene-1-carboxylic-acid synthase [Cyanobacteriota bacterium]|nr:2-succinyl-5-enolpyruvyl-6-hydroxy-3-cyclohexene-1-carboxylic-acid synthase [Cyanobacteriota bacterium]
MGGRPLEHQQEGAAHTGLQAATWLLQALLRLGLGAVVICPGSRSAALATAAWLLEPHGLRLYTAIDERSAAFFALGLARAAGRPAAVITTSGTAVAQLLAAVVEADLGTIPLLLLTADRPHQLKGCGANQSVNQEAFLHQNCRWLGQADGHGLAAMAVADLERLASRAWHHLLGQTGGPPPGPVHLNLPLAEPLHATAQEVEALREAIGGAIGGGGQAAATGDAPPAAAKPLPAAARLDPNRPGLVVAGPWRGQPQHWNTMVAALRRWQRRSGWPVLADALSGLRGETDLDVVSGYDLLLGPDAPEWPAVEQVLRLGPLPASRRLQSWLASTTAEQVLVSSDEPRPLDPLRRVRCQWSGGLGSWVEGCLAGDRGTAPTPGPGALAWQQAEQRLQPWLDQHLIGPHQADAPPSEAWLARWLSRRLPAGRALMLANSSPVRDWETFADPRGPGRAVLAFRGASGIDGTLSIACGAAEALGDLVLVSGDLALLHDSNGWLWRRQLGGRLLVLLIDNRGGGIFEQLPIRTEPGEALDFERLFAMDPAVDACTLAAAHGIPGRRIHTAGALEDAIGWGLDQPLALIQIHTDRQRDGVLRRQLRTMAAAMLHQP